LPQVDELRRLVTAGYSDELIAYRSTRSRRALSVSGSSSGSGDHTEHARGRPTRILAQVGEIQSAIYATSSAAGDSLDKPLTKAGLIACEGLASSAPQLGQWQAQAPVHLLAMTE